MEISEEAIALELGRLENDVLSRRNVALALLRIRAIDGTPHQSIENDQAKVSALMNEVLLLLDALLGPAGRVPIPLCDLTQALIDIEQGCNSRLLITGELANKHGDNRRSAAEISRGRDERAALFAYMIENITKNERSVSKLMAKELSEPADTLRKIFRENKPPFSETYVTALRQLKDVGKQFGTPKKAIDWKIRDIKKLR